MSHMCVYEYVASLPTGACFAGNIVLQGMALEAFKVVIFKVLTIIGGAFTRVVGLWVLRYIIRASEEE